MELRQYWQIILKRGGTILKIIGLLVVIVILGSFLISPVYQFKCKIWVKIDDPKTTLTGLPDKLAGLGIVSSELVMYNQLAMIRNLTMVEEVIKRMQLENDKGKLLSATEFLEPNSLALLYKKRGVRMNQMTSSQIIEVSGFSSSPKEAATIANQAADSFVAMYNKNIQDTGHQALKFIQDSIPKVSAELEQVENDLAAFKVANHVSNTIYLREKLLSSLTTLQETKDTNETNLSDYEKRIAQVHGKLKNIPEFQKSTAEYRANSTLEYIRQKLMDAESTLASSEVKTTPEYYGQKQTKSSIDKLKDEYRKQASKLLHSETTSRNSIYTNLIQTLVENEINWAVGISRRQVLDQLILNKQKELDVLTMKELQMAPLQRRVTALQTAMANLLGNEELTKLITRADLSNATILERASVPPESDQIKEFRWFPKRKILVLLSFLFSLMLGMTIIFLQEYLDDTLTEPRETEEYLHFPVAAVLPELPPSEMVDLPRLMAYGPWTQAIWAMPDLIKVVGEKSPSTILSITSSNAGEGKSLVTASLGWVLALRNLKVLLIDLNFSHPSLSSLGGLLPDQGVGEILQGTTTLEDCLRQIGSGKLYLLPSGKADKVNWAGWDTKVLAQWLATVRTRFDVLLLDLPAVGAGEGAPLAALGEQTLMVVAASHSPRTQVARALDQIQRCHARIGGLVFNRYKYLTLWSSLSPAITAATSWPPVQNLETFVKKR